MYGNYCNPTLKAKGKETRDMIKFAMMVARQLSGSHRKYLYLAEAGEQLLTYNNLARSHPRKLSRQVFAYGMVFLKH